MKIEISRRSHFGGRVSASVRESESESENHESAKTGLYRFVKSFAAKC